MRYLILLALILSTFTLSEALELNLEECLKLAIQNDHQLKAAQAHQKALHEEVNIAQKGLLPVFKLTADYTMLDRPTRNIIDANAFGPGLPTTDIPLYNTRRFHSINLIVEQPLFLGGALIQNLNCSRHTEEQSRLEFLRQQDLLQRDTENLFFQALNAQLRRQTSEKTLAVEQERLLLIKGWRDEGHVKDEDVLSQKAKLAFAESKVYQNRSRERILLDYLRNSLYLGEDITISLKAPSTYRKLAAETPDLTSSALGHRNDYLALQQQLDVMEASVKQAQSRLYPQLSIFGQYTRQSENNLDREEVWTAGARFEWLVFEWGKNLAEIRRAQAEKLRLQHHREAYAQEIRNETVDLWGAVREKETLIDAWALEIRFNETKLERILEEFREGETTLVDVLTQESELVDSYNIYRETINDLEITLARLQAALAISLDPWLQPQKIYQPDLNRVNSFLKQLPSQ